MSLREDHINDLIARARAAKQPVVRANWRTQDALAWAISNLNLNDARDYTAAAMLAEVWAQRGMQAAECRPGVRCPVFDHDELPRCIDVWVRG